MAIIQRGYVSPLLGPADPAPELSEFSLVVAFMSLKVVCGGGGWRGGGCWVSDIQDTVRSYTAVDRCIGQEAFGSRVRVGKGIWSTLVG